MQVRCCAEYEAGVSFRYLWWLPRGVAFIHTVCVLSVPPAELFHFSGIVYGVGGMVVEFY